MTNNQIIDEAIKNLVSDGFSFRENQRETILKILNYQDMNPDGIVIIDAPTGSGKSIIGMVLSKCFNLKQLNGYLLTSDLGLQTQYENDAYKYKFNIPSVRGIDNYSCNVNNAPCSMGACKIRGYKPSVIKQLDCYESCNYYSPRNKCIDAQTSLLNYSYWLLQLNYVTAKMNYSDAAPFQKRDFTIFDECHKIFDIVQGHFTPRLSESLLEHIKNFIKVYHQYETRRIQVKPSDFKQYLEDLKAEEDEDKQYEILKKIKEFLKSIIAYRETWEAVVNKWEFGNVIPQDISEAVISLNRVSDSFCKVEDFIDNVERVQDIVKCTDDKGFSFKNLNEKSIIAKSLLNQAEFKVFMSATIGGREMYVKAMGIKNHLYIEMPNTFNLSKSPILFFNGYKLNWKNKDKNFNPILTMTDKILDKHIDQRGIVHSVSFQLTQRIIKESKHSDRFITYSNSKEKDTAIYKLKKSKNGILIGPSLLEGISLDDELSRFQIFFKIPYPSLGDEFISKLLKYYPERYEMKTVNSIIQGIGRSIRNKEDWAYTYILDGCFEKHNNLNSLPSTIYERIREVNIKL